MFKDDRMISVLTALVLMVAIGTVIQKTEGLPDFFSSAPPEEPVVLRLRDDQVTVQAEELVRLDVLANDLGLGPVQHAGLTVVRGPKCGQVFVQDGVLQYLPVAGCGGERRIVYTVPEAGEGHTATVFLSVLGDPPPLPRAVAPVAESTIRDTVELKAGAVSVAPLEKPADFAALATEAASPVNTAPRVSDLHSLSPPGASGYAAPADVSSKAAEEDGAQGLNPMSTRMEAPTTLARIQPEGIPNGQVAPAAPVHLPQPPAEEDPVRAAIAPVELAAASRDVTGADELAELALQIAPTRPPKAQDPSWLLAEVTSVMQPVSHNDLFVAVIEVKEPVTVAPAMPRGVPQEADGRITMTLALAAQEAAVNAASAPKLVSSDPSAAQLGAALLGLPVDLSQPPLVLAPEAAPTPMPRQASVEVVRQAPVEGVRDVARLDPTRPALSLPRQVRASEVATEPLPTPELVPLPAPAPSTEDISEPRTASLAAPDAACVTPSSTSIDVRRAARTVLSVSAPCHAGTVAELRYSGVRFAVPLDDGGQGEILALGFEANAQALLTFDDGSTVDFDLPFKSVDRIARVALVWDQPVVLGLNALEFGTAPGSPAHVSAANPRSFRDIRRQGGGFLHSFRSRDGVGQNVEVYSYWKRAGADSGVVSMMVDFTSRYRDRLEGTCGDGLLSAPQYLVLRSEVGVLERPIMRQLAAMPCSETDREKDDKRLISEGVADLLIR